MSTAERFEQFHLENPLVYETLQRLVGEWITTHGRRKLGIRMLWEHARWEIIRATRDTEYKMNDHYTSYYVRLLQIDDPSLVGLFEMRRSPSDQWALARMGYSNGSGS